MNSTATKANHDFKGWSDDGVRFFLDDYSGPIQLNGNLTLVVIWEQSKYSITYSLDDGEGVGTNGGSHTMGSTVKLTSDIPTKSGYVFSRWYCAEKDMEFGAGADYVMPGKNVTLLALYIQEYTITYIAGGATGTVPTQAPVTPGTEITIKSADGLTVDKKVFDGWKCAETNETKYPNDKVIVNQNLNFTAMWKDATYYVTYVDNDHGKAPVDGTAYQQGFPFTVKNITGNVDGYEFIGWQASHNGTVYQPNANVGMPKDGTTLTAIWNKLSKLTLVIEGSTENGLTLVQDASKIVGGSTFVKEYLNVPAGKDIYDYLFTDSKLSYEADLYYFRGWVNKNDPAQTYNENYVGPIGMPTNDATFVVAWEGNPFKLTFDLNGGSGTFNLIEFFPGDTIAIPATAPTIAGGQLFMGWERSDMVGGALIAAGGNIINAPANNIELKAMWANPEFYVEYDKNGGTAAPANATVNCATAGEYTIPMAPPMNRAGYTFGGWAASHNGQTYQSGGKVPYTLDFAGSTVTLTAQWTVQTRTVTYNANGGTGTLTDPNSPYNYNSVVTVLNNTFTFSGSEFIKWNTAANGTGTDYLAGATFSITANTTLYAQWEAKAAQTYTITFTLYDAFNGESAGTKDVVKEMSQGESITINNANFTTYIPGYKPYSTSNYFASTYSKTITAGAQTAINGGSIDVYAFVDVSGAEYIKLTTLAGLNRVGTDATHLGKNYQMQKNINNAGAKFTPLGWVGGSSGSRIAFTGTFDGKSFEIQNFTADWGANGQRYVGLFAHNNGTIKNVKLIATNSIFGLTYVGGIAAYNQGTIDNCLVRNDSYSIGAQENNGQQGAGYAGGIAGYSTSTGKVTNCVSEIAQVFAFCYAGGIVGYNQGTITSCEAYGGVNDNYTENAP